MRRHLSKTCLAICLAVASLVPTTFSVTMAKEEALQSTGKSREPAGVTTSPRNPILPLLIRKTPQPNYEAKAPVRISGRVSLRTRGDAVQGIEAKASRLTGAPSVSVTDGFSVVKTDSQGAYSLTPDPRAVFVYLTRPAGFDIVGDWYKPLAARVDFEVQAALADENEFVFVHVTDTHVSQNSRSLHGLSRFVREVNALSPPPRFVVNSGDLLNLHKALLNSPAAGRADFRSYVGIMNHLKMPSYNVAGDHTDSSYRLEQFPRGHLFCAKPLYWEHLGPNFFSFEYGKIHFVSVDYGYHLGRRQIPVNGAQLEYPTLEVQPPHVEWMKQDMANRSAGGFVVTTSEYDLTKHCPNFVAMARKHDVRLQLVGDHHVLSHKQRPVPYRTGGALAGCWWNPKAKQRCPDLLPQGYLIYRVKGEKLDYFYKGLGRRIEFVSHRIGAVLQGSAEIQAHLVQPRPGEVLEYSINGGAKDSEGERTWRAMRETERLFYRAVYSAEFDTRRLTDGMLEIAVRNKLSGEVRTQEFVVANGQLQPNATDTATLSFTVAPPNSWTLARKPAARVDVLLNGQEVGVLQPNVGKEYSLKVPNSLLRKANTLTFRFEKSGDGMSLSGPRFTFRGRDIRDPRDEAIRQVKVAHWGAKAADWGGYIAGDAAPPDETPFDRKQDVFCFVLGEAEK